MKSIVKLFSLTTLLLLAAPSFAQDLSPDQFALQTTSTGIIQLSARKFEDGQYRQSAGIAAQAIDRGLTRSRRSAALSNLCAAQAMQGQYDAALESCGTAVELRNSWQANNNYAVVLLQMGRLADAQRHLSVAAGIEPGEAVIAANQSIVSSRTLASVQ